VRSWWWTRSGSAYLHGRLGENSGHDAGAKRSGHRSFDGEAVRAAHAPPPHAGVQGAGGRGSPASRQNAINIAPAQIATLPPGTVLLLPQSGYWMSVVTTVGRRFAVYEAPVMHQMQERLLADMTLRKQRGFATVVGAYLGTRRHRAGCMGSQDLRRAVQLRVDALTVCSTRSGVDQLVLARMTRVAP
jgi:hypothetical protein